MTSVTAKDLIVTRLFDAAVDRVWHAWSDGDHVKQWWGPTGFTCPVANIDFRVGGTSLVCMRPPREFGGPDMYNSWTYTRIVPNERLEFVLDWADKDGNRVDPVSMGLPPFMPRDVRHVITFEPLGGDRTKMTVSEYGYSNDQLLDLSKAGLEQCLDKMANSFKG